MHNHPEHLDEPAPRTTRTAVLIGVGIFAVLVILVALHLTGVVGPGAH